MGFTTMFMVLGAARLVNFEQEKSRQSGASLYDGVIL